VAGLGANIHQSDDPPTDPPPIDRRPPRRRPADSPTQVKPPDTETLWDWYAEHGHMDADPSWAKVWPTASLLCGHICGTPEGRAAVRDRHVVDMGAGIGAVGIAAGLAGARSVTFLDREPYSLHCALSSSALNGLPVVAMGDAAAPPGACAAALYDWASPPPTLPIGNADPALGVVVLAADVLYDDGQVRMLARECKRILFQDEGAEEEGARRERVVLVADPLQERGAGCRRAFVEELGVLGAEVVVREIGPQGGRGGDAWGGDEEALVMVRAVWR